jgi:hypothetical protein
MQIAQAGANRLLSPGSSRRESDLLATKAFGASLRGRRGHIALAGLSGSAGARPSSKSIHGQIKIEEDKYSAIYVQAGRQTGCFSRAYVTGKT